MIEVDRVVSTEEKAEDLALEPTVRPARLRDYIGQDRVREQMDIWLSTRQGPGSRAAVRTSGTRQNHPGHHCRQ